MLVLLLSSLKQPDLLRKGAVVNSNFIKEGSSSTPSHLFIKEGNSSTPSHLFIKEGSSSTPSHLFIKEGNSSTPSHLFLTLLRVPGFSSSLILCLGLLNKSPLLCTLFRASGSMRFTSSNIRSCLRTCG